MTARSYIIAFGIAMVIYVLTLYRPVGLIVFLPLSVWFTWLTLKRAKTLNQEKKGRVASALWTGGGFLFQLFFIEMQFEVLPRYAAGILGITSLGLFAVGVFLSFNLIRDLQDFK